MEYVNERTSVSPWSLALPMMMGEWLSASRHARLICDYEQRVLWHNANLKRVLEEDVGIKLEREQFLLTDRKAQSAFADFIQSPDLDHTAFRLCTSNDACDHIVQCKRLRSGPNGDAFGLRIICAHDALESDFRDFETTFNLTKQESLVCRQILQGKTVQELVQDQRKSPDTVRFHIKNIYQKLEVSSREAFFAKLRMFLFD
jgi:DNA-binding CsgD family transcriptional regulator